MGFQSEIGAKLAGDEISAEMERFLEEKSKENETNPEIVKLLEEIKEKLGDVVKMAQAGY